DGFDPAVRMPGKSGEIIFGDVITKIVEQQERIEFCRVAEAECAAEMHARALRGAFAADEPLHRSNRHAFLLNSGRISQSTPVRGGCHIEGELAGLGVKANEG